MGIIMYVVLYALMLQKGYQESALGRITRKVDFSLYPISGSFHWLSTVAVAVSLAAAMPRLVN